MLEYFALHISDTVSSNQLMISCLRWILILNHNSHNASFLDRTCQHCQQTGPDVTFLHSLLLVWYVGVNATARKLILSSAPLCGKCTHDRADLISGGDPGFPRSHGLASGKNISYFKPVKVSVGGCASPSHHRTVLKMRWKTLAVSVSVFSVASKPVAIAQLANNCSIL